MIFDCLSVGIFPESTCVANFTTEISFSELNKLFLYPKSRASFQYLDPFSTTTV